MTLSSGTRLGPYEILSPLGAGGMGEVYRGRDARLDRDVAIKVLPGAVAADPDALARFEREAKAIAALSHPNILSIHDVGTHDGVTFAVTELLEGETLAERLARGPLSTEALARIGSGICAALAAAHRKGIVHRDLKPSNVMLTKSGVKLLDFGLAKPFTSVLGEGGLTSAQTAAPEVTREGSIVGTLSYMAPEQLEARPVDARTDIFALGSTLYEMATGKKAFEGQSQAAVLSAILTGEPPPLSAVRPMNPPALDRLVRTCLAKDPDARWQTAHDVGLQLQAMAEGGAVSEAGVAPAPRRLRARLLPWAVAAACAAVALAALFLHRPAPSPPREIVRFPMPPPAELEFVSSVENTILAVSPDGSRIAFLAVRIAPSQPSASKPGSAFGVWIRSVSALDATRLPGTEDARSIFWSPDGRSLGFFTRNQLKRIDLSGGAPVPICDVPQGGGRSGTWGSGGDILFVNIQTATISRVPAAGGTPATLVEGNASRGEVRIFWPWYLPDGKRFLYIVKLRDGRSNLMFSEPDEPPRTLMSLSSRVQYCDPGYLVFVRDGTLLAQRFDWRAGRLAGEPFSLADQVAYFLTNGYAAFAVSLSGTLVYQPHKNLSRIAWFDRTGRELSTVGPSGNYYTLSLSRDERRLFFDRTQPEIGTLDVWSSDLSRGVETRITSSRRVEYAPLELPDGKSLVYSAAHEGQPQICRRELGSEDEELLAPAPGAFQVPQAISPDGSLLVYTERTANTPFDVWTLPLSPSGKPKPLLRSPANKAELRFSPDGQFLSVVSDESGAPEVYVMPFPGPGERSRVSTGGGRLARWSGDGREIFYLSADGWMMSAPVRTTPSLQIGAPVRLFKPAGKYWLGFIPSRDGQRFLAIVPEVIADEQPMTVVLNWTDQASRK